MTVILAAQDQLAGLIADAMPEKILSFKFSVSIQERVEQLTIQKKEGVLSVTEQEELDKYLTYDLLIGLAKARAFQRLNA